MKLNTTEVTPQEFIKNLERVVEKTKSSAWLVTVLHSIVVVGFLIILCFVPTAYGGIMVCGPLALVFIVEAWLKYSAAKKQLIKFQEFFKGSTPLDKITIKSAV